VDKKYVTPLMGSLVICRRVFENLHLFGIINRHFAGRKDLWENLTHRCSHHWLGKKVIGRAEIVAVVHRTECPRERPPLAKTGFLRVVQRSIAGETWFLASKPHGSLRLSNSVSIIRIIIPRCHEHFNLPASGPGTAKPSSRCNMIRLYFVLSTSDPGSIGDTFESEDLLRSVE
jgi:hypothetical protein